MTSSIKKAAIYSPYLDTLGGGERYMMTIAETLLKWGFEVDVLLDKHLSSFKNLKDKLEKRFNLNLKSANFTLAPVGEGADFFSRFIFFKKYDLLFYLTDGSIFYPSSKKNFLHIQSPLVDQSSKSLLGKIKLNGWDLIIFNSEFTKEHSKKYWPLTSKVIYPPVDVDNIRPLKKKKYILSVGRFFGYLRDKKHELIIKVFNEIYKEIEGWSLHLAGSAAEGDKPYLYELKDLAKGLPIKFYPNLKYDELIKLYGESSIYWHAAGFGEDNPARMEHFGISTVEAMAGGCVPVVIGKGGLREIIEENVSGFCWNTINQLKQHTLELISNENLRIRLSKAAIIRSSNFSKKNFEENLKEVIK